MQHTYSNTIHNKKVAVLGPYPPPLGGVSVHVKRVIHKLEQQKNTVRLFNTVVEYRYRFLPFYLIKVLFFLVKFKPDYVYYHTLYLSNSLRELQLLIFLKKVFKYKLVLVEHDCRHMYKRSVFFKVRFQKLLPSLNQLVLIGNSTYTSYIDNTFMLPKNSSVEVAFLPPNIKRESFIVSTYPNNLFSFLKNHSPLLLANAFQLSLLNGKDLYGLDACIDVMQQLVSVFPNVGLVFTLAQVGDEQHYNKMLARIHKHNLEKHIFIMHGQKELWPLFKRVDLFVRPTLSDGESVSIQEALYFKVPVVASNVVPRPPQAMLFDSNNDTDFFMQVKKNLQAQFFN